MAVLFTLVHLICSLCACSIRHALLYPIASSTVQLPDSIGTVSFYFKALPKTKANQRKRFKTLLVEREQTD